MITKLLLLRRSSLVGQQPLERAIYLGTTSNSLKTREGDLNVYGPCQSLPQIPPPPVEPKEIETSDVESVDSGVSIGSRKSKRKATCSAHLRDAPPRPEDLWMYIYAYTLGIDPYDCDCDQYD